MKTRLLGQDIAQLEDSLLTILCYSRTIYTTHRWWVHGSVHGFYCSRYGWGGRQEPERAPALRPLVQCGGSSSWRDLGTLRIHKQKVVFNGKDIVVALAPAGAAPHPIFRKITICGRVCSGVVSDFIGYNPAPVPGPVVSRTGDLEALSSSRVDLDAVDAGRLYPAFRAGEVVCGAPGMPTDPAGPFFGLGHARIASGSASRIVLSKWEMAAARMLCCGALLWRAAFRDPLTAFGDPRGCLRVRFGRARRRSKSDFNQLSRVLAMFSGAVRPNPCPDSTYWP